MSITQRLLVPVLSALAFASCANLTLKQSLDPQLGEVQGLRSGLESRWSALEGLLSNVENDVRAFASHPIDAEALESERLVAAMTEAFDSNMVEGDAIGASMEAGLEIGEGVEGVSSESLAWANSLTESGARIMQQLYVAIPGEISAAVQEAGTAALRVGALEKVGESKLKAARGNPLMTDDDVAALEAQNVALGSELSQLEQFSEKVTVDAQGFQQRLANALQEFNAQVAKIKAAN